MNNFNTKPFLSEEQKLRQLQKARQRRLEQQRRDRCQAIIFLIIVGLIILGAIIFIFAKALKKENNLPSESKPDILYSSYIQPESSSDVSQETKTNKEPKFETVNGLTYVDGILIANKTYSLPEDYDPGLDDEAFAAFENMVADASADGISIYICSGYRSYLDQQYQYNVHVQNKGSEEADKVSARPGYSEHQTGLAFDVNCTEFSFADTKEGKWLADNCSNYGFILRYPQDKEDITGFSYEPWHIRYLGVDLAKKVTESGLCLEEYLGITSEYKD